MSDQSQAPDVPTQPTLDEVLRHPDLAMRISGRQGWRQMLTWKQDVLAKFDSAKRHSKGHEVETHHGNVAEAEFRKWLREFLPRKFGVTAGYIVSPGLPESEHLPEYDVIVYDQMNSPVLWVEGHSDMSPEGLRRAIPVEYVQSVIEVKASFNSASAKLAADHLLGLEPILGADDPGSPYRCHLPEGFRSWSVFFDLKAEDNRSFTALDHLARATTFRGYSGGIILRGAGLPVEMTGEFGIGMCCPAMKPLQSAPELTAGSCYSNYVEIGQHPVMGETCFGQVDLKWSKVFFTVWPFYLLKMLNEDYSRKSFPSYYCLPQVGEPWPDESVAPQE